MNYILKSNNQVIVDKENQGSSVTKYLNNLLLKRFKDVRSLIKNTKRCLNIKRCVPLYVDSGILLVPLTGYDSEDYFAFNYYEIKEIESKNETTTFYFIDGTIITVNISKHRINNVLSNARRVDEYIQSIY